MAWAYADPDVWKKKKGRKKARSVVFDAAARRAGTAKLCAQGEIRRRACESADAAAGGQRGDVSTGGSEDRKSR